MRRNAPLTAMVTMLALLGPGTRAVGATPLQQVADSMVSFDFQEADVRVVLTALAEAAQLTIVHSGLPSTSVTLRTAQPVDRAGVLRLLQNVGDSNGLRLREDDGILVVTPGPRARGGLAGEEAVAPIPEVALHVHALSHAPAELVVRTLRALFGLRGELPFLGEAGQTYSLAESMRDRAARGYESLQPPVELLPADVAPLGGAAAGAAGGATLLSGPVELVPDVRNNAVLILSGPEDLQTIQEAITQLDTRPLQVLIEAVVVEVRHDEDLDVGIGIGVPPDEDGEGLTFEQRGVEPSTTPGEAALSLLGIGDRGGSVVLRALASTGDVRILSRPAIIAQNNNEARILVGEQRPFTQLARSLPTDLGIQDRVIQFQPVGTELIITPTINRDGFVNLHVLQQVSSATAEIQFGAPVIDTREADTRVLLRDGQTAVLGGLVDRQQERRRSGIPVLKDIPILGYLFGRTTVVDLQTELFILLTPRVLETDADLDEATRRVQERERIGPELGRDVPIVPPLALPTVPDTLRPDTLRPDTLRPDTLRPDTLGPDTLRRGTQRPDTLRLRTPGRDGPRSDTPLRDTSPPAPVRGPEAPLPR